ncbi:ABC transporter permease [Aeromicrobium sp.]|uniref:ABC transporter permease n=1 Tax=Aeromicrobium sp. TaxID=1871063 RepID=UPI002626D038|nr:ABC transporter permease [Aeromicrobium sp.]
MTEKAAGSGVGAVSPSSAPAGAAHAAPAGAGGRPVARIVAQYGVVFALLLLIVAFSILLPDTFPTLGNAKTIVNSSAVVLVLALAATLPLRAGGFDLSIAGTMIVSAGLVAKLTADGTPWFVALVVALGVGAVVGAINAALIVRLGLDGFVVTLGTLTALEGVALAISGGEILTGVSQPVINIATHQVLGIQSMTWFAWILVVVLWYVYNRTPAGRYLLFVGGSPDASKLAGLPVTRIRTIALMSGGAISGFAGFLLAGSFGAVDTSIAGQYLLQPYAAAFLGATTIAVGRFNAIGTLIGLYLLVVGIAGLQLFGATQWATNFFNGCALIAAITFAKLAANRRGRA